MYQKPSVGLSIGGVLEDGFKLTKASFTQVFPLALLGAIFGQLPTVMLSETAPPVDSSSISIILGVIVSMLGSILVVGALISKIHTACNGQTQSISEALRVSVSCFLVLSVCSLLYGLAITGGMILLIVPGIILSISLLFGPYLVVTDGLGPIAALRQSHKLVWGDWWRTWLTFTVVIVTIMVTYILISVMAALAGFGDATAMEPPSSPGGIILTVLLSAVIMPIFYAFALAILNDLKLRKEGDDSRESLLE
jgi:hypothetical protein